MMCVSVCVCVSPGQTGSIVGESPQGGAVLQPSRNRLRCEFLPGTPEKRWEEAAVLSFARKHTSQSALQTLTPVFYASEMELLFPTASAKNITVVTVTHKTRQSEEEMAAAATAESDQELQQLQKVGTVTIGSFLCVSGVWFFFYLINFCFFFLTAVCERRQGNVLLPVDGRILGGLHRPINRRGGEWHDRSLHKRPRCCQV